MKPPRALIERDQWIFWLSIIREGKVTKVPCSISGRPISVTDPGAWNTYEDARGLLEERGSDNKIAGLGFCFTEDDPFIGVDLDGCFPRMSKGARAILERIPSYAEVSPSGTGIKIFAEGDLSEYKRNRTSEVPGFKQLEVYQAGRFFTVTGERFGVYDDVQSCQDGLTWLMDTYLPNPEPAARAKPQGTGMATGDVFDVVQTMTSFKNGDAVQALWDGDCSAHNDDQSSADLALVAHIAFVVGPDPERIDKVFRESGLMRDKWDSRRGASTYGERTIEKVLDEATEFYTPPGGEDADMAKFADDIVAGSGNTFKEPRAPEAGNTKDSGPDPERAGGNSSASGGQAGPLALTSFPIPRRGIIRDMVDLFSDMTESPDSTIALGTLVMLSAVTGWKRTLTYGESTEPCLVFACIAGPSAVGRKTTGMNSVASPFEDAGFTLRIESGGHVSGRGLIETAMGGEVGIFYTKPPPLPEGNEPERLIIDGDQSYENPAWTDWKEAHENHVNWHAARQRLLEEPPPTVMLWDEFGKMLNVEGDWQRDTRAELLSMYSGKHRGIKTSGKGGISVPKGKVNMALLATMTDDELRRAMNSTQISDGLMGRIIFSPPGDRKPPLHRSPKKGPEYEAKREAIVRKLLEFQETVEYHRDAHDMLTEEADEWLKRWYHDKYWSTDGIEHLLWGRMQATAVKFACLFAMAEASPSIELEHIQMGIEIIETASSIAIAAHESHVEAQRDRYTDAVRTLVLDAPLAMSKILERGMLGGKEPGETMPTREERITWITRDPNLTIEKSATGKGHIVRAT